MTGMLPEEVMAEFMKNWALSAKPVALTLHPDSALAVLGNLQLALRHPANTGPSALMVQAVCNDLVDRIAPDAGSPVHALCMAGFDPAHDKAGEAQPERDRLVGTLRRCRDALAEAGTQAATRDSSAWAEAFRARVREADSILAEYGEEER